MSDIGLDRAVAIEMSTGLRLVAARADPVAQEGQPGGTTRVLSRRVVTGEDPSNYVLVDLDVKRQGDLLGDARTAPVGITLLHLHDRTDEFCTRSFRAGLATTIR